jgi:hypothetical protein
LSAGAPGSTTAALRVFASRARIDARGTIGGTTAAARTAARTTTSLDSLVKKFT